MLTPARVTAAALLFACAARAEEIDYKKLYSTVAPAVVLVYGEAGDTGSIGSGSIIHRSGLVVTNAHVILDHATQKPFEKLFVFLKPDKITGSNEQDLKRAYRAQWITYNPSLDLALVQMEDPPDNLSVVSIADGDVSVGEATAAIGHPEHGARWSLTTGRIGGEWADFEGVKGKDVYQMETSVNRGNSGGPLLDGNGNMVGINTSIARRSEDGLAITGVNFALKSSVVRRWLSDSQSKASEAALAGQARPVAAQPKATATPQSPGVAVAATAAPVAPPSPQVVAAAPPAPAPEEKTAEASGPVEWSSQQISRPVRPGEKPRTEKLPPAPPPGKKGYRSREPPGKTLTPEQAVRWRAQQAFDDLDAEGAKHPGH